MPELHLALQDGFRHDTVIVRVNGVEHFNQANVTTRTQIGHAGSAELDIPAGPAHIEVSLPLRAISHEADIQPEATPYLGISIRHDGTIHFRTQNEPFGYV